MDQGISKVIKQLQDKHREFIDKARKIEATIASLQDVFGEQMVIPEALPRELPTVVPINGPYVGMGIGDAAVSYLASVGLPQKTRTIALELEAGGIKSTDTYRAIYNALGNRDNVYLDETKKWGLKKWLEG
jgi:hypothetical protein